MKLNNTWNLNIWKYYVFDAQLGLTRVVNGGWLIEPFD